MALTLLGPSKKSGEKFKFVKPKTTLIPASVLKTSDTKNTSIGSDGILVTIYKKVIELRYFNELSYKEISNKLNQPINNIKIRVMRAKRILAELISHD